MFLLRRRLPRLGRWTRLAIAATCTALAVSSALDTRAARIAPARTGSGDAAVVVAAHDLPGGRLLSAGDLAVHRWPARLVPTGSRAGPAPLVGHRLAGPVLRGEPVTSARLVGRDLVVGLAAGMLAVPVPVTDVSVTDLVHAGDRIDLVAVARSSAAPDIASLDATPATIVASHLLVLASLPDSTGDPAGSSSGELVVAADRDTALRITRASAAHDFTALGVGP